MLNRLFKRLLIVFSILSSVSISNPPAHSETAIYAWQDESGTISYTDDPTNAPSDAEMKVFPQIAEPQAVSEPESTQIVTSPPTEPLPRTVTQGEFAVRLVEELGLAEEPTEEEAADLLVSARISPILGEWELDQPMTPELTVRLRKLTVASADRGWITLTPEQGLLAFDTASALMGLTIPVTTDVEETAYAPVPIAETPPLVYVDMPPPAVYPYYIWTPVAGGFWWNGFVLPGFFVLDVNIFFSNHHHRFPFRDHRTWDSGNIERRFRSHIVDHRIREFPPIRDRERMDRSPFHPGRGTASDRTVSLPKNYNPDFRPSGSYPSKARPEKRYGSPQAAPSDREIRQRPSSRQPDSATPKVKPDPSRYTDSRPAERRLSPRPVESMPKVRPSRLRSDESTPAVRSFPPGSVESMPKVRPSLTRPAGSAPELDRRTPPSSRPPSQRSDSSSGPSGGYTGPSGGYTGPSGGYTGPSGGYTGPSSAPPRSLPDRSIGDPVVAPRQPAPLMDRRTMASPQRGGFENIAGRGPVAR